MSSSCGSLCVRRIPPAGVRRERSPHSRLDRSPASFWPCAFSTEHRFVRPPGPRRGRCRRDRLATASQDARSTHCTRAGMARSVTGNSSTGLAVRRPLPAAPGPCSGALLLVRELAEFRTVSEQDRLRFPLEPEVRESRVAERLVGVQELVEVRAQGFGL